VGHSKGCHEAGLPPCGAQGGSDVITRTATKRINWASYKINQATDRIGVFVSVVSTKIPYKGAGKEYICARSPCGTCSDAVPVSSVHPVSSAQDPIILLPAPLLKASMPTVYRSRHGQL